MPTKTDAIANFLRDFAIKDLADLYNYNMEVQVNVAQDDGERVSNEGFKGRASYSYAKDDERWYPLRIPKKAATEPEYTDGPLYYDLSRHAEAIGMTGWDWVNKCSKWVAYDFDSIAGHSDKHASTLTDSELQQIQDISCKIPWITVRKSSGGSGLHLYVFLDDVPTQNHTEHAALGRAILGKMSVEAGFDFSIKVDACGGNMWVWHRKAKGTEGFQLVSQGEVLSDIPINWKDHLDVVKRRRTKSIPSQIKDADEALFEQTTGQRPEVKLDDTHKRLFKYLEDQRASWWWDADHHMLVCHTYDLKRAHDSLGFRGVFDTVATGREQGVDHNCFAFPLTTPDGAWSVRRYTPGIQEAANWEQDSNGWTCCYLNRDPTLKMAARAYDGVEDEKGNFHFADSETAESTAKLLGGSLKLPPWACGRTTILRQHKDGRLICHIKRESNDNQSEMSGWHEDKGLWKRIFDNRTAQVSEDEQVGDYEDVVRHAISMDSRDSGWMVQTTNSWVAEPLPHIKIALKSRGLSEPEINKVLGSCVFSPWVFTNEPFVGEYPGGRRWNRGGAQLNYIPQEEEPFVHPAWDLVLKHCGQGLDDAVSTSDWCRENSVIDGTDYLKLWIASLFQFPKKPLPYLFLYSKAERTGKSTLHEALSFLVNRAGYAHAGNALTSPSNFNGELAGAVLCVVEETDLSTSKTARNRLKDWVTSLQLSVHIKNLTPYLVTNTTHYIQTANDPKECPVFPGDTRITMVGVPQLDDKQFINREDLHAQLKKEAPAFLGTVLNLDIPKSRDRLNVPVIETEAKIEAAKLNRTELEVFLEEECYYCPGNLISYAEVWNRYQEWLSPEIVHLWSKIRMGKELPPQYPKGRVMAKNAQFYVGNISFAKPEDTSQPKIVKRGNNLIQEKPE